MKLAYKVIISQVMLIVILFLAGFFIRSWYTSQLFSRFSQDQLNRLAVIEKKIRDAIENVNRKTISAQQTSYENIHNYVAEQMQEQQKLHASDVVTEAKIGVAASLSRGEIIPFQEFADSQECVKGMMEFAYFGVEGGAGKRVFSSTPDSPKTEVPAEFLNLLKEAVRTQDRLEFYLQENENEYEYYVPLVADEDQRRLNPQWQVGDIYGIIYTRFSKESLKNMKQTLHAATQHALQQFVGAAEDGQKQVQDEITDMQARTRQAEVAKIDEIYRRGLFSDMLIILSTVITVTIVLFIVISKMVTIPIGGTVKKATEVLSSSIQDLVVSAKEISTTSNQQSVAVKEIVSTMEDSDRLSKGVAAKTEEVSRIAEGSKGQVQSGFSIIEENMNQMQEIKSTNEKTISGIKALGEHISSIWEVVSIINRIADQTKIIAFNAELEASSAGEAGKHFQIVATEVRRLADNTMASTTEIRSKIKEIQRASDSLVLMSEMGTDKIKEGWQLSLDLRKVFDEILKSADTTATSAKHIVGSMQQQVRAFEQILLTLKQISNGIEDFVTSTTSTTNTAETLQEISENLRANLIKTGI